MSRMITLVASACVLLCRVQVFGTSCDTVVFRHDFDTSVEGRPDPEVWVVNRPDAPNPWWSVQARTHFPNPAQWLPNGEFPRVENGVCIIEHHLYNPYDLAPINTTFLGGEIRTIQAFKPDSSYRFEARVRWNPDPPYVAYPNGLVNSFFLYGYDGSNSDEIDFEFVSNKANDEVSYPCGDPVLTNAWNESHQCPEYVAPDGLDLTEWNTFRIYWYPGCCVRWTWLDPVNGETLLRTETAASCVADQPMSLYFNFWAPCGDWPDAYDGCLQPVGDPAGDEASGYEIDYAEACVISEPDPWPCGDLGGYDPGDACDTTSDDRGIRMVPVCGRDCPGICACGDIDGDGDANLADFVIFARCFGLTEPSCECSARETCCRCNAQELYCSDLDGDGTVTLSDFVTFARLFGQPATGAPPDCE